MSADSPRTGLTRRRLLEAGAAAALMPACTPGEIDTATPSDPDAPIDAPEPEPDPEPEPAPEPEPEPDPGLAFDPEGLPEDRGVFPIAVMAGAMRETSLILSTQVVVAADILVRVWQPGLSAGHVDLAWEAMVTPGDGGFMKVVVEGLRPGETWSYGFFLVDGLGTPTLRSDLGTVRTAPASGDLSPLVVALSSCNGLARSRWSALGRSTTYTPDAILHLGDMAYNDDANSLAEFRESWRGWLESEGYRAALAGSGLYYTWDDHEIDNGWDGETVDPTVFAAAHQAATEALPIEVGPEGQLWRSFRWGDTAEIFVLDCRSERRPSTRDSAEAEYLSPAQFAWFTEALRDSPAQFKIVMNSVPITNMPPIWDLAADDRWEGYPAQREALLGFIADEDIRNVWFVSGDFHVCFVSRVEPLSGDLTADTWEIAVTSGNVNPLGELLIHPQFTFNTSLPHTCVLRFDPVANTVTIRFVDPASGDVVWEREMRQ